MARVGTAKKLTAAAAVSVVLTLAVLTVSLYLVFERFYRVDAAKSRPYFSEVSNALEQGVVPEVGGVDYALVADTGAVTESTCPAYPAGQAVALKTLAGLNGTVSGGPVYFTAPRPGGVTLILAIEPRLVRTGASGTAALCAVCCVLCAAAVFLTAGMRLAAKNGIFLPLAALSDSVHQMAGGDYSRRVPYDYTDEIGRLCHDVEILRDDLAAARDREDRLKKNEKFLLACISHDLKTPLAVISGSAESLKDGMLTSAAAADSILGKTAVLNKLIDDILEQTQTELGEFSIVPAECYAKDFFETELRDLSAPAKQKNISFTAEPCPECLLNIDKRRIGQVLQNLIGNAVKYTPACGAVTVRFAQDARYLTVSVADTGVGIPARDLSFIFDKFYRGEKARTQTQGSGLGLTIAKYIIEKHGGAVECDSVPDKGTEIRFTLPLFF